MIPEFDEHGYLPAGIHHATLEEIEQEFGCSSEIRRVPFESLVWLVEVAATCDVLRIIINGSYVTDVAEPNDVDCLLLVGDNLNMEADTEQRLLAGFPFLDVQFANADEF